MIDPNIDQKKHYAQDILENLDYIKNEKLLVSNLFDPRLFLIDNSLEDNVILECKPP